MEPLAKFIILNNYMLFFAKLHNKYITKLFMKTRFIYLQFNDEVKLDKVKIDKYNSNNTESIGSMMSYITDNIVSDKT